eukprot:817036-Amphidinium_carterae.1
MLSGRVAHTAVHISDADCWLMDQIWLEICSRFGIQINGTEQLVKDNRICSKFEAPLYFVNLPGLRPPGQITEYQLVRHAQT